MQDPNQSRGSAEMGASSAELSFTFEAEDKVTATLKGKEAEARTEIVGPIAGAIARRVEEAEELLQCVVDDATERRMRLKDDTFGRIIAHLTGDQPG